jgi:PAS domain S-box-containing protein
MNRPEHEQPGKRGPSSLPDPAPNLEEAARSRASADLYLALCRLVCSGTPTKDVDRSFLEVVLDSLGIDRAAILLHLSPEGSHSIQNSLGFPQSLTDFHPPHPADAFFLVSTENESDPLADSLREAVGVQNILWVLDDKSGKSLLLGNSERKTRRGFALDQSCRKIADAALQLYLEISKEKTTDRKLLEEERELLLRNMGERVKELCCMYEVSDSIRKLSTQEEIFREVSALIPSGLQYPENTRGRVIFDGMVFAMEPFEETKWRLSSDIVIEGELRGCIEVYYLQERPEEDEGPFFREERALIDGIARVVSEVVERKQVDRERTELLKTLEAAREAIHISSPDGIITYTNSAMDELFGYQRGELLGKSSSVLNAGPEPMAVEKEIVETVEESGIWEGDIRSKRKDGTELISHARVTARRNEEGKVMSFLSTQHDITERRQSEKQQEFSNRLLEIANRHTKMKPLLDDFVVQIKEYTGCSAVGIRMLDEQGNIPYQAYRGFPKEFYEKESPLSIHSDTCMCSRVITGSIDRNLSCFTASGCFYVNGTSGFLAVMPEEAKDSTRNECNKFGYESVALIPIQIRERITGLIHVADERTDILPLEVVEVLRHASLQLGEAIERVKAREAQDQAERKLEEQRALSIASDRLRSLGEMAAGIAHELNQPLVGVRGLAEHIMIGLDRGWKFTDENIQKKVRLIVEQSERMTHIIDHVRVFAKEAGNPEVRLVQVNEVILSSTGLVNAQLRARGIEIEFGLTEDLPYVLVNPFSLEEVILNMISNARDAIEEKTKRDPGSTVQEILLRTRGDSDSPDGSGQQVVIEVVDRGIGISAENLPKVFDPFFTTKGPDRGTGLGLAVSKSIIEQFGGTLEIRSEPNQGTTAIISLKAERLGGKTPEEKHEK